MLSPQTSALQEITTANFQQDVIDKSSSIPVLVDFWATWCGPCKQLTPILETLAEEFSGRIAFAKVDVDAQPQIAGAFQIKSMPTVILLKDGQPIDGFSGAQPLGALREWLNQHLNALPADEEIEAQDESPADIDPAQEIAQLQETLVKNPDDPITSSQLAILLVKTGQLDQAETLLQSFTPKIAEHDAVMKAQTRLQFTRAIQSQPSVIELKQKLQASNSDLQSYYLLGLHYLLNEQVEQALEQFLHIMQTDRKFENDLGRKTLISALTLVEDEDLVSSTRRKMAALIF